MRPRYPRETGPSETGPGHRPEPGRPETSPARNQAAGAGPDLLR